MRDSPDNVCCYVDHLGERCHEVTSNPEFCYWHDPECDKTNSDTVAKLEKYANDGGMLHGLQLQNANLENLNLLRKNSNKGFDLTGANLYNANLKGANLFNVVLIRANLMNADLSMADLHCSHLEESNLFGIKLNDTKLEHLKTGKMVIHEEQGKTLAAQGEDKAAVDHFEQAEEVYRNFRKASEKQGLFSLSGPYLRKELTMRRFQLPLYSQQRFYSKIVDLFCGYGEDPFRVVSFSLLLILFSSFFYYVFGLHFAGEFQAFSIHNSSEENITFLFECLYYSVVTFTTLGYGDFIPIGLSRLVAAVEAFLGSFTIALFVVVFVKKMTR